MYHYVGSSWVLNSTLVNQDTDAGDDFGNMVQLSGDGKRMIVSAGRDNLERGKLYTFEYTGTSWRRKQPSASFGATGVNQDDHLGYGATTFDQGVTLSRDGSVIVGGELGHDTATLSNAGRVRVWNMPSNIKSIWGSNDDVNWTKITTAPTREEATSNVAGLAFGYDDRLEFKNLDNPNYYKYHAIVADAFTRLKDVKLYGIRNQGSSTLHDGTLTLTKNLDVPRIGPPLDADDTPRRDRLVVEYNTSTNPVEDGLVQDTSGRGNDGMFYGGASYDASQKALGFDAVTGTALESGILPLQGDAVHSFSLWFNRHTNGNTVLVSIATSPDTSPSNGTLNGLYVTADGGGSIYSMGNDVAIPANTFSDGSWLHVVCIYKGGGVTVTTRELYVNSVKITFSGSSGAAAGDPLNFTNPTVALGAEHNGRSNYYYDGSISQFKLYDTALTAEDVKTLYDMGRCSNAIPKTLHIMGGMMRYNNDINRLQIHNGVRWSTIGGITATGGTITQVDGYTIHTFISSGTFTLISGGEVEYLVVAGGGAGGYTHGGAGGGGGVLTGTLLNLLPDSYTITRGAGGAFVSAGTGGNGSNSTALGLTAIGGGGGGRGYGPSGSAQAGANGSSGGSGGGGGPFNVGGAGTAGPPIQGYVGGNGINDGSQAGHGGGGGGAGGVGGSGLISGLANQGVSGKGGIGLVSLISGSSSQYAGGGSGGRWGGSLATDVAGGVGSATGGGGIGGAKSNPEAYYATAGTSNTGGGGGGGGDGGANGGNGGSGIVIIRYLM